MKVLLYFENINLIKQSGIGRAFEHQKKALELAGIQYTTDPEDTFDIAHVNTYYRQSRKVIKYCKKNNIPVIVHAHSTIEDFQNSFRFWSVIKRAFDKNLQKTYSLPDLLITPTPYSKKLLEKYSFVKCPIKAISNGIDLNEYQRQEISPERIIKLKEKYGIKKDDKLIMGIGWMFERKGILDFFEVAKLMPNHKFIWFGSKNNILLPGKITKAIENKPTNVILPGFVPKEEIIEYLQISSCFFFPSYEETEGIVSLEALALKTPLIVRDIGVFDYLEDKIDCLKGTSINEFVELINTCIATDNTIMVNNGYNKVKQNSIENVSLLLNDTYNELLNKRAVKKS